MILKKIKEKALHSVINNVLYLLKDIYKDYKLLLFFIILESIFSVVIPVFGIYLPKIAIDLVTENASTEKILFKLGIFTVLITLVLAVNSMAVRGKYFQYNDMRTYYQRIVFFKTLDCDYMQIESTTGQDRYQKAIRSSYSGDESGTSVMITSMIAIFTCTLSFVIYSGIIAMLNPLIVLLLAGLSVVNYITLRYARNYEYRNKDAVSSLEKKLNYIEVKSADVTAGKDVRLYNMAGWFVHLRDRLIDAHAALKNQIQNRHFISSVVDALTLLLRDGTAYAYLIWAVSQGRITVGEFVLYFGAITGFSGWVSQIVWHINRINGANLQMNDMRAFLECSDAPEPENPVSIPDSYSGISIEFVDVCFSYDMKNTMVLRNFNMKIGPGEKVALVGVNGAGKTTIVKLLCGFYYPDSGKILINGTDIRNFHRKELYKLFSAVFQDITILPFSVAENISMKIGKDTDKEKVWNSLKSAGLEGEIRKYERDIDSMMLKISEQKGIILSGGQQQKLLMARALYKDAPVLILDEPTAALDPIAESEIYEKFHNLSKNKTVIYISHRLASTRFCDNIVYIKNGTAAEVGTHDGLIQKGGEYAAMFEIQSHYYKTDCKEAVNE
jgi:ATP-binding cassette, subfamily B, bacterial